MCGSKCIFYNDRKYQDQKLLVTATSNLQHIYKYMKNSSIYLFSDVIPNIRVITIALSFQSAMNVNHGLWNKTAHSKSIFSQVAYGIQKQLNTRAKKRLFVFSIGFTHSPQYNFTDLHGYLALQMIQWGKHTGEYGYHMTPLEQQLLRIKCMCTYCGI